MKFNLVITLLCCLSSVLLWVTSALTHSPEGYWKSELPNTPIPKRIKDIIPSDVNPTVIGKAGIYVDPKENERLLNFVYKYFIKYKTKAITQTSKPTAKQFPAFYFFFEQDLHKGKKLPLSFPKSTNPATFLPREVADSVPFSSSDKIVEILQRFGINVNSVEGKLANDTIQSCNEGAEIKEEKKDCVTSLESMVDLIKAKIGVNAKFVTSEMHGENRVQNYTIAGDVKPIIPDENEDVMSCHKSNFVFSVFYCHSVERTKVYMVPMVGDDGTRVDAVAICHGGTAGMSPEFWAFRVLGTKPGSTFCHFLPRDHIVFYN